MNLLRYFFFVLCLIIAHENAHQAVNFLNQNLMSCCCEVEKHSDSCSECPEEVASDYCGCKDFSLNFISPDLWIADYEPQVSDYQTCFYSSFFSWHKQPDTPPPKLV